MNRKAALLRAVVLGALVALSFVVGISQTIPNIKSISVGKDILTATDGTPLITYWQQGDDDGKLQVRKEAVGGAVKSIVVDGKVVWSFSRPASK